MPTEMSVKILTGDILTIEVPGLTAIRIDTESRVLAIDGISGVTEGGPLTSEWAVRDLRGGTYGDFHRLKPSGECSDASCARSEHVSPVREVTT